MNVLQKTLATIESSDDEKYGPNGGFTAILSTPSLDRDGDNLKRTEWMEPLPDRVPLDMDHGMTVATTIGSFHPYFDGEKMMMDAYFASTKQAQDVRTLVNEGHIRTVSVAFMNDKAAIKDGKPHRELLNAGIVAIPSNRDAVVLESKALDVRALEHAEEKGILDGLVKEEYLRGESPVENKSEDEAKPTIIVNVVPRIDEEAMKRVTAEVLAKAGAGNGDLALLQAIHDASVHLGAQCAACEEPHAADMPQQPGAAPAAPAKPAAEKKPPAKSHEGFVVAKSISGSVEDLGDRIHDALRADCPADSWAWVRATFLTDSKSGTLVYTLEDGKGSRDGTYARDFTDSGEAIVFTSEPRTVTLVTSVVEKSTKSVETKATVEVEVPEHLTTEEFQARLAELINETPSVSNGAETAQDTAESPADEEPAPVDETAAASEDAADDATESDAVLDQSALMPYVDMLTFASVYSD